MPQPRNHASKERGSALIMAVLFAFVIMLLTGSYLYLAGSENRMSSSSFLMGATFNLAEGGLDLGLNALNNNDNSGWQTGTGPSGDTYWAREFSPYDLGSGVDGGIRVVILGADTDNPKIYAEGRADGNVTGVVSKQIRAEVEQGFFPFRNGFNSKETIELSGNNVIMDSYDSSAGPYGGSNVHSNVTVSTIAVENDAVDVGNADIYGYVATGGGDPDVGPNGSITDYSNPGVVDESRITKDFYSEFPDIDAPELSSPSATFPTSGVVAGGEYEIGDWKMAGKKTLHIAGDTIVVSTGSMGMSGKAELIIEDGASLTVYAAGDVSLGGNGVLNKNQQTENFIIFGTAAMDDNQTIKVAGNGYLAGSVYAPTATVEMNGGGSSGRVFGAVAAYDASVVGNSHFSYDEAMADYKVATGSYSPLSWVELSGAMSSNRLDMDDFGL
ncbi:MAG: hypothetical protein ACLFUF_03455 [Opitutales bacterium]